MIKLFNTEKYGRIIYEENIWTGRKKIFVNNHLCVKQSKNEYLYSKDDKHIYITISGNPITGQKMHIDRQEFVLFPSPKWYEVLIAVLTFVIALAWGNSPLLVRIFPIVGGAIGGGVSGVMTFFSIYFMKMVKKPLYKILIGFGFFVGLMLLLFLLGMIFISALIGA